MRASGMEATVLSKNRRKKVLIKADEQNEETIHERDSLLAILEKASSN